MHIQNHWLDTAKKLPSPNFDQRSKGEISLIVIHCISLPKNEFGGDTIDRLFTNKLSADEYQTLQIGDKTRLSSHILITRDGGITQYVAFDQLAWHAGHSHYQGRDNCNDFSIGIELEGTETTPYTESQYQQLAVLIQALINNYEDITTETITAHSTIAPGRKTDPGASFVWDKLAAMLV